MSFQLALHIIPASLLCHSNGGRWVSMESMGGGLKGKDFK